MKVCVEGLPRKGGGTLAGWLSWLQRYSVPQKDVVSIPGQGTYIGRGFDPW